MEEKEKVKLYEELLPQIENGEITKRKAGELMGFTGKRPDDQLKHWVKKHYEIHHVTQHTTHHNTHPVLENKGVNEVAFKNVMYAGYFQQEENLKILVDMIEAQKNKTTMEEITEIIDTSIPERFKKKKNEQKSFRVNTDIVEYWEKELRKDHSLADLPQAQLLNLTLLWAVEKIRGNK